MSDIFREVDEEIRHERFKRLWERFGLYLIAFAVLVVAGTAAYRGWVYWQQQQAQAAGDVFVAAGRLAEEGKFDEARARLAELGDAAGGYPALARLRAASLDAEAGRPDEARAAFEAIAADTAETQAFRDVARLRAGYLALDAGDFDAARRALEALTTEGNPWRFLAEEGLALAAWKSGDLDGARRWVESITTAQDAPGDIVARAGTLRDLLNAAQGTPENEADS